MAVLTLIHLFSVQPLRTVWTLSVNRKSVYCVRPKTLKIAKNLTQLADEMDKLYKNQKRSQNVRRRKRRDLRKTEEKRTQYYAGNRK